MILDLHVHSSPSSFCASITPEKLIACYKEKGYDGIVLTNHFNFSSFNHFKSWQDYEGYVDFFYDGYLKVKEEGEKRNFAVLFGVEIAIKDTGYCDYLIYGITYEFLKANTDIFGWSLEKLKDECDKCGFLLYQAHPFRRGLYVKNPSALFGVEVFNGTPSSYGDNSQHNELADELADKNKLHKIAGSDCHHIENAGTAGIITYKDITAETELVEVLKNDDYRIFHTPTWGK